MQSLPLSREYSDRSIVVCGSSATAVVALQQLLATGAQVTVFAPNPDHRIIRWAKDGHLDLKRRRINAIDLTDAALICTADDSGRENGRTVAMARQVGIPFIAAGDIKDGRPKVRPGQVGFVGAGPGDPDLLTLKAYKALGAADVVIHDALVSAEILALAGDRAVLIPVGKRGFSSSTSQDDINDLIVKHARAGAQVIRLKGGDPAIFARLDEEVEACIAAALDWYIVPGITAASTAAAAIGQGLTQRGRNASVRFLTGHDMNGFADHDWSALARRAEVAAIYMGKKSARFLQGRLLMHGADAAAPVTIVENASRPDQKIVETTLGALADDLASAGLTGPALTLYGLAPRSAAAAMTHQKEELA